MAEAKKPARSPARTGAGPPAPAGGRSLPAPAPGTSWVVTRETAVQVPTAHLPAILPYGMPPRWLGNQVAIAVIGVVLPVFAYLCFHLGHAQVDQRDPVVDGARLWYGAAALAGAAGLGAVAFLEPNRFGLRAGIAAIIALPMGVWYAAYMQSNYGWGAFLFFFGGLGFVMWMFIFGLWVATGVTTLVMGGKRGGMAGADAAAVGGLGLGLMFAGAALYHLLTLDEQADLARKAHETPGLGLLAGLAALAAVAWAIRRRHR